ncbi:MAG: leucine-rich repeat protein, partial [Clostridia bacterium]|nr:leucine-rich repeat protein [Clostridia bacterium]
MKKIVKIVDGKKVEFYEIKFYGTTSLFRYDVAEFLDSKIIPNKSKIKNIILGKNIREIEKGAFSECDSVEYVVVPADTIVVREKAFENCPNLKKVEFQSDDTDIYCDTFNGSPLKYFYKPVGSTKAFASTELPVENCDYLFDVQSLYNAYGVYNFRTFKRYSKFFQEFSQQVAQKLNKHDLRFNFSFVENVMRRHNAISALEYLEKMD